MTTARELWPPGSKYDILAIRQRLKAWNSIYRWTDPELLGQNSPIFEDPVYSKPNEIDLFDALLMRYPDWVSVHRIRQLLCNKNGASLPILRQILQEFMEDLIAAGIPELMVRIDLNADWEKWHYPPIAPRNDDTLPHPRIRLEGRPGGRTSVEIELFPDGVLTRLRQLLT